MRHIPELPDPTDDESWTALAKAYTHVKAARDEAVRLRRAAQEARKMFEVALSEYERLLLEHRGQLKLDI